MAGRSGLVWASTSVVGALVVIAGSSKPALHAAAQAGPGTDVSYDVRHDTSPPLRDIPFRPPAPGAAGPIPRRAPARLQLRPEPGAPDPLAQTDVAPVATPAPISSFEGLSDDDNAAVLGGRVVPPDTQGDVGPNHYVQHINLVFAVYDKTGNRVFGPVAGNSIWSGFGGYCEFTNDGDPIVLYDHLADRWLVSQFSVDAGGMCIAVSTTGDPTGSYHRYAFTVSPAGSFPDYPKLGVWPDGYYMSANEVAGEAFQGAIAVAFERDAMLVGGPARFVRRGPLPCEVECYFSLQPSHLNGPAPPPGTPNTYITAWDDETWGTGDGADGYRMFEFAVDWGNPVSSTFTQLPMIVTPEFDANLCRYRSRCIEQPRRGERLASLSHYTMYRAQLRYDVATSTSRIVVNHTVDVSGRDLAGIRWAVLRKVGAGGWQAERTGTHAGADRLHRWMGSLAMDQAGNLALGYSVSGRDTFPSIRYATNENGGSAFGPEVELQAGAGVQMQSFNRWGDYSTMSVDPVDGCTFWYTQEYYANSGSFDFKTRIGSFRVPSCN